MLCLWLWVWIHNLWSTGGPWTNRVEHTPRQHSGRRPKVESREHWALEWPFCHFALHLLLWGTTMALARTVIWTPTSSTVPDPRAWDVRLHKHKTLWFGSFISFSTRTAGTSKTMWNSSYAKSWNEAFEGNISWGSNAEDMPFFASRLCPTCSGGFHFFSFVVCWCVCVYVCLCVCIGTHDQYGMCVEVRIQFCKVSSLSPLWRGSWESNPSH